MREQRRPDGTVELGVDEAKREIAAAKAPGLYDAFVVNDDLERAVAETLELVRSRSDRLGAAQVRSV